MVISMLVGFIRIYLKIDFFFNLLLRRHEVQWETPCLRNFVVVSGPTVSMPLIVAGDLSRFYRGVAWLHSTATPRTTAAVGHGEWVYFYRKDSSEVTNPVKRGI